MATEPINEQGFKVAGERSPAVDALTAAGVDPHTYNTIPAGIEILGSYLKRARENVDHVLKQVNDKQRAYEEQCAKAVAHCRERDAALGKLNAIREALNNGQVPIDADGSESQLQRVEWVLVKLGQLRTAMNSHAHDVQTLHRFLDQQGEPSTVDVGSATLGDRVRDVVAKLNGCRLALKQAKSDDAKAVAMAMNASRDRDETKAILEGTLAYVQRQLDEAGCGPMGRDIGTRVGVAMQELKDCRAAIGHALTERAQLQRELYDARHRASINAAPPALFKELEELRDRARRMSFLQCDDGTELGVSMLESPREGNSLIERRMPKSVVLFATDKAGRQQLNVKFVRAEALETARIETRRMLERLDDCLNATFGQLVGSPELTVDRAIRMLRQQDGAAKNWRAVVAHVMQNDGRSVIGKSNEPVGTVLASHPTGGGVCETSH